MITMSKIFQCSYCDKIFANRHNLSRHRKTFHLKSLPSDGSRERGNGMTMDYTPGYGVGDHHKSMRQADTDSIDEDATSSEDESEYTSAEGSNGDDASCPELDQSTNNWLWEKLVIMRSNKEYKPLDRLHGYLLLYILSESDKLFQDIMSDVVVGELKDLSFNDAIEYALDKNEESIIASVNRCEENEGDESFWCALAGQGGEWYCQWLTGESCNCEQCDGASILKTTVVFIKLFIAMRKDHLIQQIEADVEEMSKEMVIDDAIDKAIQRYEKVILGKLRDAEDFVNTCGLARTQFF